jgi:hypothetical protein
MYVNKAITAQRIFRFPQVTKSLKVTISFLLFTGLSLGFLEYKDKTAESQTLAIISNPKVNDIYFLDFRLLSDKLRPKEKYRIAKVVDITGNIVTLVYGRFFYQYQNAAINSIQYGQLSYKEYFEPKRYNIPLNKINSMHSNQAIYLAKRPIRNKLFGNLVGPAQDKDASSHLTYGKKENIKGEAFLKEQFSETNLKTAFELFLDSSRLGYAKGQVNLAEMYINGQHVKKDFNQALYWLKKASLKSYKPAILKYGIICKQIKSCDIVDFYQNLTAYGVNIKVRKLGFKISK